MNQDLVLICTGGGQIVTINTSLVNNRHISAMYGDFILHRDAESAESASSHMYYNIAEPR